MVKCVQGRFFFVLHALQDRPHVVVVVVVRNPSLSVKRMKKRNKMEKKKERREKKIPEYSLI